MRSSTSGTNGQVERRPSNPGGSHPHSSNHQHSSSQYKHKPVESQPSRLSKTAFGSGAGGGAQGQGENGPVHRKSDPDGTGTKAMGVLTSVDLDL